MSNTPNPARSAKPTFRNLIDFEMYAIYRDHEGRVHTETGWLEAHHYIAAQEQNPTLLPPWQSIPTRADADA